MASGIYTAMQGALAKSYALETVANNLANARTPAFKRQSMVYRAIEAGVQDMGSPRQAMGVGMPRRELPRDRHGVIVEERYTHWAQGHFEDTGEPFDFAIEGEGFFVVQSPDGPRYTRNGALTRASDGTVVTQGGLPVLDRERNPIKIAEDAGPIIVTPEGTIFGGEFGDEELGTLGVVRIADLAGLERGPAGLYAQPTLDPANPPPAPVPIDNPSIRQGHLEMGNVNAIRTMTELIKTHRLFELNSKAIQSYRQMDQQASREIGRMP